MDSALLRRYVRMIIAETPLARVPTQLLPPKEDGEVRQKKDDDEDEIDEMGISAGGASFAASGALSGGPNLPLGTGTKTARDKKRKKRQ